MNVLFLTIGKVNHVEDKALYTDLLRVFRNSGHSVYAVSANERRSNKETEYVEECGIHVLRVKIGNIKQCGIIEKGISTLCIEHQYLSAIKNYISDVKFDLIMYSTPPITFANVIKYFKKRDGAKSYLLLKDIFPQNAVDIGMMSKSGVKGLIYKYFRKKEKKLYALSDRIGCMSQANVDYVLKHNPEINPEKVEVCPNSIDYIDMTITENERIEIRNKYGIPLDKKVFVYGGNLGKPQGIPFLIECLKEQMDNPEVFFVIVGDGTEYKKLHSFFDELKPSNMKLMKTLPKEDYDIMVAASDVGLIFLDHRFTIPNFPSRLLSYMQSGIPVLACTDPNTDIGRVITDGGFGWWCESNDAQGFGRIVNDALKTNVGDIRQKEIAYLKENYLVERSYRIIVG